MEFTGRWSCCNMLTWNTTINLNDLKNFFIWLLLSTGKSLYYISTQPFSTTCKHRYKMINLGNEKFMAYTPCLKCHFQIELTGLRRVYVGIGSLVWIINLPIAPVANVLMRLDCQGKGTEHFSRQWLFFKPGQYHHEKAIFVPGKGVKFRKILCCCISGRV